MVKNPPAVWETWPQPLGQKDTLEKGMATHSSILVWRIPMDRGAWQATVHRVKKHWAQLKSALATGLEKVSFHSNRKERQCQRILKLPHNCTYLTH